MDDVLLSQLKPLPSDDDIMGLKKIWLDEGDDYHTELQILGEVARQYYKGRQTGYDQLAIYESHAVENRLFMADETTIPLVTSRLPSVDVIPASYNEVAVEQANKVGDIVRNWMDENNIQQLSEVSMRSLAQNRFYVWNVYYDDETEKICQRYVPTKNCYFPRYAYKNLPWFIEKQEYNISDLVEEFGEEALEKVEPAGQQGLLSTVVTYFGYGDQSKERKGLYIVYAIWTKKWCAYVGKSGVLKKFKNPYWKTKDTTGADIKDLKEQRQFNHFDNPKIPYIIGTAFENGEETVGITSLYEQGIPMQDVVNKVHRYYVDYMETVGDPKILIDSSVMSREESEQITSEAGRKYWGKGIANANLFRVVEPPNMPSYIPNLLNTVQLAFDNIYGMHSTTRGQQSDNPTLGQDKLQQQSDFGRLDIFTRIIGRSLDELGDWVIQMIVLYWDTERDIPLLSDSEELGFVEGFSNAMVEKGLKFKTKPGTSLPDDKVSRANVLLQLAKLQMIRPLDLYKGLGLPDPQGLEDSLVKWKTGQVGPAVQPQGNVVPSGAPGQPQQQISPTNPTPPTSGAGGATGGFQ